MIRTHRLKRAIGVLTIVSAMAAASANAAPITISVTEADFTAVSTSTGQIINPDGVADISFSIDDANGNNVVDQGEITAFSFDLSNFTMNLLNFSSTDFAFSDQVGVANSGGLRALGDTGLDWEGVTFSVTGSDGLIRRVVLTTLQLSLSVVDPNAVFFPLVAGDNAQYPTFAADAPSTDAPSEVPLPAAAPLMALGLAGLGFARGKKRKS